MQTAFNWQLQQLDRCAYDLAILGGQRQRYGHFGFEVCGSTFSLAFTPANVRHTLHATEDITFHRLEPDDGASMERVIEWHRRQLLRVDRPSNHGEFHLFLRAWESRPYIARCGSGRTVGLMVLAKAECGSPETVLELLADTPAAASSMVWAWLKAHEGVEALVVTLPPTCPEVVGELARWSESCRIIESPHTNMFRIFAWDRVVDALLRARLKLAGGHLPPGGVMLALEGRGQLLGLHVGPGLSGGCSAAWEVERAEAEEGVVRCNEREAMRLLFGPLPPLQQRPLPAPAAGLLAAWCPLPLHWPPLDAV